MSKNKGSPPRSTPAGQQDDPHRSSSAFQHDLIGFVGLGRMGSAMAANLAAAGRKVTAYVRRPEQIEELKPLGVKPTISLRDLFDCEFVVSMLPDDASIREVIFGRRDRGMEGLAAGLAKGALHVSMSTISTETSSELATEHARHAQGYVAAPVFGNPDAAKSRQLYVIAAGASPNIQRCRPIFDALGQQTFVAGDDPAKANLIKLLGNALGAASIEIIGEIFALARKRGLDPNELIGIFTGTMFGGRFHRIYGGKIAEEQYCSGGFVLPLALKDVRLALHEAETASVPTPSLSVVRDRLITGIARGYSDLDWTALALLASEEAGLSAARLKPVAR
jgi:3-hydroxyisobutyrate dehydrogenase-like beta-hydroxyacid dehydrogenase